MAKPLTEKNEKLKKEMLSRLTPEQAAKFEARKKIKLDLLEAIRGGDLKKVKKLAENEFGIDITKMWYKKGNYPGVTVDMDCRELALKYKKQDIADWFSESMKG
jgi:hypothetical protein